MGKPYSMDLRQRVVAAVVSGGLSCNRAAKRFGVGISTAINWVQRVRETGSVAPGKMGGHKPKKMRRTPPVAAWADQGWRLHLARAGGRTRRARAQGRLSLGLGVRPC
jgi:transposase-like protein